MAEFHFEPGPVPLHHQVYLEFEGPALRRGMATRDRLPPERELALVYGCSLITVRRALSELTREQRIERTPGRGTTVLRPPIERDLSGTMSSPTKCRTVVSTRRPG